MMHGKLLKVKHKLSRKRKDSAVDVAGLNSLNGLNAETSPEASLLGLPPEIRNSIYDHVAANTTLHLSAGKPRKSSRPIGLLLACKQTYREYRALLFTRAPITISVSDYNFSNLIRIFERLDKNDLDLMRLNGQLWIELNLAHVPSREDRKALRAWCDYRKDATLKPYFGAGQRVPEDLIFQYNVRFTPHMRGPRPPSRYPNGFHMKHDILRTHFRAAMQQQPREGEPANPELERFCADLEECAKILQDLMLESVESRRRSCTSA